ncbi:MAG: chemotaxis protein CheC [Dehalococcoidia bacterium]
MSQSTVLNDVEKIAWAGLVNKGVANAISGLSEMVGEEIKATALKSGHLPRKSVADLLGGPEALIIGVYLGFEGSASGNMVLAYHPKTAFELIDMLMGMPLGSTQELGEMEESALREMGNIMGTFFLNVIADANGLSLCPTPPSVKIDRAEAVLDAALSEGMQEADEVLIVDADFGTQDQQIGGTFLVVPSADLMMTVRQKWSAQ